MEIKSKIDILLGMKNIERLQGTPKHRGYNLLEHGFNVAMMFKWFAYEEDISYNHDVFVRILMHDALESITGDLIQPVKNFNEITAAAWESIEYELSKSNPLLIGLTDENLKLAMTSNQHILFKTCDYLDLWIFCINERLMGNNSGKMSKCIKTCEYLIYKITDGFKILKSVKKFMVDYEKQ